MNTNAITPLKLAIICLGLFLLNSCSSQKDTAMSRSMQNLTARYNYIYNSNQIITDYEATLQSIYPDNYDEMLTVYPGPKASSEPPTDSPGPLDDILKKAQTIIGEKSYSNYIDDSYLLMGKANYYKNNYFNSTEYFDYTAKAYRKDNDAYIEALTWKARSLLQLQRINEASVVLDSLETAIALQKKPSAEPLAVIAQSNIYKGKITEAISYLERATERAASRRDNIRWNFLLAQLYEQHGNYEAALSKYRKVSKSNTDFEMYFNSKLNIIRINHQLGGNVLDKEQQLLSLLRDEKNLEYNDQVYYQIAESYSEKEEFDNAHKNYLKSLTVNTVNTYQKGLAYLRIADLKFSHFRDYVGAKLYYDSAVNTLPTSYKGYDLILKKTNNLEYLTSRYKVIDIEDELQLIAQLPEEQRVAKIQSILTPLQPPVQEAAFAAANFSPSNTNRDRKSTSSTFYFSNQTAIAKGLSDFKRQWGNRKLEENWRQSVKSSYQANVENTNSNGLPSDPDSLRSSVADINSLIKEYTQRIPVTPQLLAESNQKIVDAYFEIASFYQQELNDIREATRIYEMLLKRFPQNNHLPAIYYSLYLGYSESDRTQAERYKGLVLSEYPTSVYAKTILDPSFSIKLTEQENALNSKYNLIFDQYERKSYNEVIENVNQTLLANPQNRLSPQLAYLGAIAVGRTNNVDSLLSAFRKILVSYPDDKLIVPLVKEHLEYINAHLDSFKGRPIALVESDSTEPTVISPLEVPKPLEKPVQVATAKPSPQVTTPVVAKTQTEPIIPSTNEESKPNSVKTDGVFTNAPSQTYYFVINVSDASLTLSSSRFGIGQFNRGNYAGANLKHQLLEFDNEQLIYVGIFNNFEDAKVYATGIIPQLKQIMKVPPNIYTSFVISKENFDKLTSKTLITRYQEFYKNSY